MALQLREETLITLQVAAVNLPGRPHISTLHRWQLRGVRGVLLETCLIGGNRYTSIEALQRFIDATTLAANASRYGPAELSSVVPVREVQRNLNRRHQSATDYLDRAGI